MKIKVELPKDSPNPQIKLEFEVPEILIEAIKQKLPVKLTLETDDKKQED
jgi:hypothetical protein